MRALGVDFGSKRIGLAMGVDDPFVVTTAYSPLIPSGTLRVDAEKIAQFAKSHEAEIIVVGIPQNKGDERMENVCKKLVEAIEALSWPVVGIDERMSSIEAEDNLRATDLKAAGRRKLIDGEAARIILERFFEQKGR